MTQCCRKTAVFFERTYERRLYRFITLALLSSPRTLCVFIVRFCPVLFVLWSVNDVGKVQSLRPFPLQSTLVRICVCSCVCVRACMHATSLSKTSAGKHVHISPVGCQREGSLDCVEGRKRLRSN